MHTARTPSAHYYGVPLFSKKMKEYSLPESKELPPKRKGNVPCWVYMLYGIFITSLFFILGIATVSADNGQPINLPVNTTAFQCIKVESLYQATASTYWYAGGTKIAFQSPTSTEVKYFDGYLFNKNGVLVAGYGKDCSPNLCGGSMYFPNFTASDSSIFYSSSGTDSWSVNKTLHPEPSQENPYFSCYKARTQSINFVNTEFMLRQCASGFCSLPSIYPYNNTINYGAIGFRYLTQEDFIFWDGVGSPPNPSAQPNYPTEDDFCVENDTTDKVECQSWEWDIYWAEIVDGEMTTGTLLTSETVFHGVRNIFLAFEGDTFGGFPLVFTGSPFPNCIANMQELTIDCDTYEDVVFSSDSKNWEPLFFDITFDFGNVRYVKFDWADEWTTIFFTDSGFTTDLKFESLHCDDPSDDSFWCLFLNEFGNKVEGLVNGGKNAFYNSVSFFFPIDFTLQNEVEECFILPYGGIQDVSVNYEWNGESKNFTFPASSWFPDRFCAVPVFKPSFGLNDFLLFLSIVFIYFEFLTSPKKLTEGTEEKIEEVKNEI